MDLPVNTLIDRTIREHKKAARELRISLQGSPKKARQFLIRAGILNKKGTKLSSRCQ